MSAPEAIVADLVTTVVQLTEHRARVLVGVVGAPGAGKSTLTAAVMTALHPQLSAVVVPMDGFHLAKTELERLGRLDRKGAIDTFDGAGYVALLRRLREPGPDVVYAPEYVRGSLESSIGSAIPVAPEVQVVLTEGNYLLVDADPWRQVPGLLDATWYLDVDPQLRRRRLYERHLAHGKSPELASTFTFGSDETNAALVESTRDRATRVVPWG